MEILATVRPARDTRPPAHRLLEPVQLRSDQPTLPWDDPAVVAEPASLEPELRQFATTVVAAMVEALAGRRSPTQLEAWMEIEPLELLEHLHRSGAATGIRLRSLRIQRPSSGSLEVAAHLRHGSVSRAAAVRFSRLDERWVVTRLEVALRPQQLNRSGWRRW